jgi:hypothetical protein
VRILRIRKDFCLKKSIFAGRKERVVDERALPRWIFEWIGGNIGQFIQKTRDKTGRQSTRAGWAIETKISVHSQVLSN